MEVEMTENEKFLTMQDLADRYGVALQSVRAWRVDGYGPKGFKVGRLVRYPLSACIAWEQEQIEKEAA